MAGETAPWRGGLLNSGQLYRPDESFTQRFRTNSDSPFCTKPKFFLFAGTTGRERVPSLCDLTTGYYRQINKKANNVREKIILCEAKSGH